MVLSPVDASIGAAQGIIRDVTARRRYEDELLHIASHDFLTGLFNRRRFEEELERVLASTKRQGTEGAVLWIDLDNFKDVNDTLGHHAGDELLVDIARALRASVRAESVLARLGGDEFAILLPVATRRQARDAGERLLAEIAKVHIFLEGRFVRARGSMGIVMFPGDGLEVDELLAHADVAMYRAKQMGRARSVFFARDKEWHDEIEDRRSWAEQIELAVRENTFHAFAQPIVGLGDGVVDSFELLDTHARRQRRLHPARALHRCGRAHRARGRHRPVDASRGFSRPRRIRRPVGPSECECLAAHHWRRTLPRRDQAAR